MAFDKKTWLPRISEYPNRRILTDSNQNETQVSVTRDEGTVSQQGDKFDADTMNDLENRIDSVLGGAEFSIESDGKLYATWTFEGQTIKKALGSIELDSPLATVDKVVSGYHFATIENGETVEKVGTFAAQTKTETAGTSAKVVTPDSGKYLSQVSIYPTPAQSKSATPSTSQQTISPDNGYYLASVSIDAIPTNFKYASAINQDPGKRTTGEISVDIASRKYFITAYNGSYGIDGYNGTSWVNDIVTGSTAGSSSSASNNPVSVKSGTLSGYVKYRGWINPYNNGRNGSIGIAIGI